MRLPVSLAATIVLVLGAGYSHADEGALTGQKVIVVPLGGTVPNVSSSVTAKMSEHVLSAMKDAGANARMAQSSLEDLLMLNGCTFEQDACLRNVAGTLGVDAMFVGEISGTDDSDTHLTLRRIPRKGDADTHEIALTATDEDALVEELAKEVGELYPPPAPAPVDPPPEEKRDDIITPPPVGGENGGGFSLGNVKTYTWVVTGAGVMAAAAGGVFLISASGKQSDIDDHPTTTLDDLKALQELEDDARTQFLVGDVLLIAGAVTAAVGVGLIVVQGRGRTEERQVVVSPMITRGGTGLSLTWGVQ